MQLVFTTEGYPALLKTRTRNRFFSERDLSHGNRTTQWVYLTQNPRGRWQVLAPDPDCKAGVICVAGGKTAAQVLPTMVECAYVMGILKRGTRSARSALGSLGSFVTRQV